MFGTIEKRPAFEQYWQRISSRPAYLRAKELDDAKAAEMKKAAPRRASAPIRESSYRVRCAASVNIL